MFLITSGYMPIYLLTKGVDSVDIAKLSMAMAQADLMQQLSVGLMKKAIEMNEMSGELLADMLDGIPDGSTFSAKV